MYLSIQKTWATKIVRVVAYHKGLLDRKSYESLITWSCEFLWNWYISTSTTTTTTILDRMVAYDMFYMTLWSRHPMCHMKNKKSIYIFPRRLWQPNLTDCVYDEEPLITKPHNSWNWNKTFKVKIKISSFDKKDISTVASLLLESLYCVKKSVFGVILTRIFPHSAWIRRDTIQSQCGKIWARITPNMGIIYAVYDIY